MEFSNPFEFLLYLLSVIGNGFSDIVDFFGQSFGGWLSSISTGNVFVDAFMDFIGNAMDDIVIFGTPLGSVSIIGFMFGSSVPILLVVSLSHWILRMR